LPTRRSPPPWSVEELHNGRRGRSASPPRSWAVSRNRHHMSILQYSGTPSLFCYEHQCRINRGGDRRRNCSRSTRRGESRQTLRSCRDSGNPELPRGTNRASSTRQCERYRSRVTLRCRARPSVATWVDWLRSVCLNAQRIKASCLLRNSGRLRSSGRYDCFAMGLQDYCD
jgi:hypothetical protein